jgi:methylmalonyl-CoA epimerase
MNSIAKEVLKVVTEGLKSATTWRLDHVAILVRDLDEALDHYCALLGIDRSEVLGGEFTEKEPGADKPVDVTKGALIPIGESFLEFIQPVSPDGAMMKALQARGEGLHHISISFPTSKRDKVFQSLRDKGFKTLGDPEKGMSWGDERVRYTFLHPKVNTNGVLIEVLERLRFRRLEPGEKMEPGELEWFNAVIKPTD